MRSILSNICIVFIIFSCKNVDIKKDLWCPDYFQQEYFCLEGIDTNDLEEVWKKYNEDGITYRNVINNRSYRFYKQNKKGSLNELNLDYDHFIAICSMCRYEKNYRRFVVYSQIDINEFEEFSLSHTKDEDGFLIRQMNFVIVTNEGVNRVEISEIVEDYNLNIDVQWAIRMKESIIVNN